MKTSLRSLASRWPASRRAAADARRREARWAHRLPASRRSSSRSSAWGWTTSSRSKPAKRAWVRHSTARAAPSATTSRPSAAPERWPSCGPDAGTRAANSRRSTPPATRSFTCSRSRATGVSRCCPPTRMCSRAACPFRSSEPGSSRPFPMRRCWRSRILSDRNGDGVSGRAGARSSTSRPANAASDGSGGRRSMPR